MGTVGKGKMSFFLMWRRNESFFLLLVPMFYGSGWNPYMCTYAQEFHLDLLSTSLGQVIQMHPLIKNHCSLPLLLEQWSSTLPVLQWTQDYHSVEEGLLSTLGTCVMINCLWPFLWYLSLFLFKWLLKNRDMLLIGNIELLKSRL